ncbi:MAG: HNH endonuclease [Candidatus Moranbacteria bacterium]|nr:HNH endonuclease [Candidatus Moranbacteria bacterium]
MTDQKPKERKKLSLKTRTLLLTEAGYRCAVPTCRGILALDMHHIWEVNAGGGDDPSNLIALCPTCHALYHRGTITEDSIYIWKSMLTSLSQAFDREAIDNLLFLHSTPTASLALSGDGVLHFSRLIAAGLATYVCKANNAWQLVTYVVVLTEKGQQLITAWKSGNRELLEKALNEEN